MPPTSSLRKASIATTDSNSGRRQSGRQARTSTSRPINYYARNFGSLSHHQDDAQEPEPPGFFPAIQYFADSIAALPREVQRHITLMKEVEAKVYGPTEALKHLSTNIMAMPVPPPHNHQSSPRLLTFTAPTSATNSMAGSVVNGGLPGEPNRPLDALEAQQDEQADQVRRAEFSHLRHVIGNMIANLDEKNVVMAEANRALAHQIARLDSVIPHIENEISEESRLGSLTHWAYAENRSKKQTVSTQQERNRRDVAATSSLAAAAAAVHEGDIAAARGEARRENKKTQRAQAADSDFDERPAKRTQTTKARKGADAETKAAAGLGIANGTTTASAAAPTTKRRKVEKASAAGGAPAMERSASNMSAVGKAARAANTTPRSTPTATAETTTKKKTKPGPLPGATKKRNAALNQSVNSPKLVSSPVLGMGQLHQEAPTSRPSSSRVRQNSTSNLQHSLVAEKQPSRPASVSNHGSVNGNTTIPEPVDASVANAVATTEVKNGTREEEKEEEDKMDPDKPTKTTETSKPPSLKDEDVVMEDGGLDVPPTRGRTSKISTPRIDNFADSVTRTRRRNGSPRGSNTPTDSLSREYHKRRGRRKSGSGAHILKQIASFNRSPDAGRRRDDSRDSDVSEIDESGRRSQPPRVTTVSRGRRGNGSRATTSSRRTDPTPEAEEEAVEVADEEEGEEAEDPNEPKYCYCGQGSFGEMIACDNDDCPMEWFHLGCTGLRAVPGDNVKWYCDVCKEAMQQPQKGKKAKPGNNRH